MDLKGAHAATKTQVAALNSTIAQQAAALSEVKGTVVSVKSDAERAKEDMAALAAKLQSNCERLTLQLGEHRTRVAGLQEELDAAVGALAAREGELQAKVAEADAARAEAGGAIEAAEQRSADAEAALAAAEKTWTEKMEATLDEVRPSLPSSTPGQPWGG